MSATLSFVGARENEYYFTSASQSECFFQPQLLHSKFRPLLIEMHSCRDVRKKTNCVLTVAHFFCDTSYGLVQAIDDKEMCTVVGISYNWFEALTQYS